MAQLIRSSINLTTGGANGVTKPQGTLYYGTDAKYYVTDSGPSSPYAVGTGASASYSTTATTYASNGTWNNPLYFGENISMVLVFLLGGGGGGAKGPDATTQSTLYARGGAGGGASVMIYPAMALGPTYPITVGAGGTGATTSESPSGSSGGSTTFGDLPGSTDAVMGGSAWFNTLFAAGGSGGTQAATGQTDAPGGMGLYMGSPSSVDTSTKLNSLFYSGAAGGRGSGASGVAMAGGTGGFGFSGGSSAPAIAGGALGADGTTGSNGTAGTSPSSVGIMRAGSGGGGGGRATTVSSGGTGGDGGIGSGGGGGGAAPTGGTPGNGGNGGAGYAIVVSW
jgi:hypothetical protein